MLKRFLGLCLGFMCLFILATPPGMQITPDDATRTNLFTTPTPTLNITPTPTQSNSVTQTNSQTPTETNSPTSDNSAIFFLTAILALLGSMVFIVVLKCLKDRNEK